MKTLIVQKRLAYSPGSLDRQAGPFIEEVQQLVREAKEQHRFADFELADIGFIPAGEHIEVKLYFRQPAGYKKNGYLP
ncbi:MAG: hypothetical protein AB1767_10660 [Bacillota bacterium]